MISLLEGKEQIRIRGGKMKETEAEEEEEQKTKAKQCIHTDVHTFIRQSVLK